GDESTNSFGFTYSLSNVTEPEYKNNIYYRAGGIETIGRVSSSNYNIAGLRAHFFHLDSFSVLLDPAFIDVDGEEEGDFVATNTIPGRKVTVVPVDYLGNPRTIYYV